MNFYVEVIQRQANDLGETIGRLQDTYLTDKTQPLEERWAAYEQAAEYMPIDRWISDNLIEKAFGNISLYDEFNIQRYQTVKYKDILEGLLDDIAWAEDYRGPEEGGSPRYNQEQVDKLRELVLASGKQGFIFDW